MPTVQEPSPSGASPFGLKYFRIRFRYRDSTKYLRLMGWSEQAVLREFSEHFPDALPEHVECLGTV